MEQNRQKFDPTLINKLKEMAAKEKKINEFKQRLRVRGRVGGKVLTKSGNLKLTVKKGEDSYPFIVLKSHKERFALAQKLATNTSVSVVGINKFRFCICTKLKVLEKGFDDSHQKSLSAFS